MLAECAKLIPQYISRGPFTTKSLNISLFSSSDSTFQKLYTCFRVKYVCMDTPQLKLAEYVKYLPLLISRGPFTTKWLNISLLSLSYSTFRNLYTCYRLKYVCMDPPQLVLAEYVKYISWLISRGPFTTKSLNISLFLSSDSTFCKLYTCFRVKYVCMDPPQLML